MVINTFQITTNSKYPHCIIVNLNSQSKRTATKVVFLTFSKYIPVTGGVFRRKVQGKGSYTTQNILPIFQI